MSGRPVTVSVALTAYNQARFIAATIESVLAQTTAPDEILIVDDGSTDDTVGAVRRYGSKVRLVQQQNCGVAGARNRAVLEARGDFVALLDGDDLWLPHKIERCVEAARHAGGASVIVHDIETVSADAQRVLKHAPVRELLRLSSDAAPSRLDCWRPLTSTNFIYTTSQVMIQRRLYIDSGLSDPQFRVGSDYDLYLRLAQRVEFLIVPEVLARWRQHESSASGAGRERQMNWRVDMANVLRKHAATADSAHAPLLRTAATASVSSLMQDVYRRENEVGSWTTAVTLCRVAIRCRAARSAALAVAVLAPERARRLAASLTGIRFS